MEANMPLIRISLKKGKPAAHRRAIADGVYEALRETFNVPEHDRFVAVHEHDEGNLDYDPGYFGFARGPDFVTIQITASNTRTVDQKKALFAAIMAKLAKDPGLRADDVFINIVEVAKENWSFGAGVAQYA
jgi:4-oxalocrotonate tautomerase